MRYITYLIIGEALSAISLISRTHLVAGIGTERARTEKERLDRLHVPDLVFRNFDHSCYLEKSFLLSSPAIQTCLFGYLLNRSMRTFGCQYLLDCHWQIVIR